MFRHVIIMPRQHILSVRKPRTVRSENLNVVKNFSWLFSNIVLQHFMQALTSFLTQIADHELLQGIMGMLFSIEDTHDGSCDGGFDA